MGEEREDIWPRRTWDMVK